MVGIIDYNMGNVGSISNMLKKVGQKNVISNDINILNQCDKLILPGVGSFDNGIKNLKNLGLDEYLKMKFLENLPILGICLGMQLFAKSSEEGLLDGLGFVDGEVKGFKARINENYNIPHMGWNYVDFTNPYFFEFSKKTKFYFVHSYFLELNTDSQMLCETNYNIDFCSGVKVNNLIGVQFHPEKSHNFGIEFFKNFLKIKQSDVTK